MDASALAPPTSWDAQIRAREEALRLALLNGDLRALDELVSDDYIVNSTQHKVVAKALLLQLVETGRLRHLSYETRIETMRRHGDTVVVMGGDRVVDGPDRVCTTRRFTNLWQLEDGRWRATARHAHVVAREGCEVASPPPKLPEAPARAGAPRRRAYQPTP